MHPPPFLFNFDSTPIRNPSESFLEAPFRCFYSSWCLLSGGLRLQLNFLLIKLEFKFHQDPLLFHNGSMILVAVRSKPQHTHLKPNIPWGLRWVYRVKSAANRRTVSSVSSHHATGAPLLVRLRMTQHRIRLLLLLLLLIIILLGPYGELLRVHPLWSPLAIRSSVQA